MRNTLFLTHPRAKRTSGVANIATASKANAIASELLAGSRTVRVSSVLCKNSS
jgi:hypothetical protein